MLDGFRHERHEYGFPKRAHGYWRFLMGSLGSYPDVVFYRWGGNLVLV